MKILCRSVQAICLLSCESSHAGRQASALIRSVVTAALATHGGAYPTRVDSSSVCASSSICALWHALPSELLQEPSASKPSSCSRLPSCSAPSTLGSNGSRPFVTRGTELRLQSSEHCTPLRLLTTATAHHCDCSPLRLRTTATAHHCDCSPLRLLLLPHMTMCLL